MKKWYQIALLNLVVLTLLGLILRYKINFPLPFIQQKNLLHAHSHFAFTGWISFLLQLLILDHFTKDYTASKKFWDRFFVISTVVNYATIVAFACQGYAAFSIILSTAALWLSYAFTLRVYKSLHKDYNKFVSTKFIKASLFFLILSSLGPYALAIIIATKSTQPYWNHNALYFFLHFQYNGWFTFAVFAFLFKKLEKSETFNINHANKFFAILFVTCIPSYLLTALFRERPDAVTIINIATTVLQAASLYYLWKLLKENTHAAYNNLPGVCRWLYSFSVIAFVLKVLLQFFSAHPQLGQLAFAFRPIIIGYLHLIFLVFISLYLLSLLAEQQVIPIRTAVARWGMVIFSGSVIFNEILLAIQGFAAIAFVYLPSTYIILFINTIVMLLGASLIYRSSLIRTNFSDLSLK